MKKLFAIFLTVVFVFNLVAVSVIGTAANESPATDKICDYIAMYTEEELSALTADANDYYVSVFVMFNYSKLDTRELDEFQKETRLSVIRNYYHTLNLIYAWELGIPTDAISSYTPYAEIAYESIEEYEEAKDFVYNLAESDKISLIEISIMKAETYGSQSTSDVGDYDQDTIFSHVGITNHTYTGDGIKIGFVEKSIFQGATDIPEGKLFQNGGYIDDDPMIHAHQVVSIAAGDTGIAFDASCYVSAWCESNWKSALEWLIDNNVDIINASVGFRSNQYTQLAAYIDYLVDTTDILVVAASGTIPNESHIGGDSSTSYYSAPALSANALTVNAINIQKSAYDNSLIMSSALSLAKPDLVAPGVNLCAYSSYVTPVSGTSYSAGIVSGIAARLMEEFPLLKNNAHLLKAVLIASCERLPGQTEFQDPDAGAGLINYNNARTIMENQQYGIVIKEPDSPEQGGAASFWLNAAPAGSTVTLRYVIPVSGSSNISQNGTTTAPSPIFSTYNCIAFNVYGNSSFISTITEKNTGYVPLPTTNTTTIKEYCIDMYIGENRNEGVTEYIQFAYLIS